jgi:hypothetical protein
LHGVGGGALLACQEIHEISLAWVLSVAPFGCSIEEDPISDGCDDGFVVFEELSPLSNSAPCG